MAANTQFSIAIHLLAALAHQCGRDATSGELAVSVNTSPSFLRRTIARLAKAGLIETSTGKTGACRLAREPRKISLLDVYRAVDAPPVFAIHSYANQKSCVVSCRIKTALENAFRKTQKTTETGLRRTSLADILADIGD